MPVFLALAAFLCPLTLLAECTEGSCTNDQDVTSLMQFKAVVELGAPGAGGKASRVTKKPPATTSDLDSKVDFPSSLSTVNAELVDLPSQGDGALTPNATDRKKDRKQMLARIGITDDFSILTQRDVDDFISRSMIFHKYPLQEQENEYCWRDTEPRGAGEIPDGSCPDGPDGKPMEKINVAGFIPACYEKCDENQGRRLLDCVGDCPKGWRDDGDFCRLAEYGRGSGYNPHIGYTKAVCEKHWPTYGCEHAPEGGWFWYPTCRPGWKPIGCCICAPDVNNAICKKEVGENSYAFADSCAKHITRTSLRPKRIGCPANLPVMDAGLCYKKCTDSTAQGIGPVCWHKPPETWVECGMGAASSKMTCAKLTGDQIFSVLGAVAKLATLGAATPIVEGIEKGIETAEQTIETAERVAGSAITLWEAVEQKDKMLLVQAVEQGATGGRFVEAMDNMVTGENLEDQIRGAALVVKSVGVDPTGVSGLFAAYTYPKCSKMVYNHEHHEGGSLAGHHPIVHDVVSPLQKRVMAMHRKDHA